jgi:hypothetical protein
LNNDQAGPGKFVGSIAVGLLGIVALIAATLLDGGSSQLLGLVIGVVMLLIALALFVASQQER